jgi:hypothetical protein
MKEKYAGMQSSRIPYLLKQLQSGMLKPARAADTAQLSLAWPVCGGAAMRTGFSVRVVR